MVEFTLRSPGGLQELLIFLQRAMAQKRKTSMTKRRPQSRRSTRSGGNSRNGKKKSIGYPIVGGDARDSLEARVLKQTEELHAANRKLENEIKRRKGLEGEILEISDREQQRLGQELHDGICQHLTAVAFMARSVALRLKNHRVIEVDDLEKIAELVNAAAADTRNVSRALHRIDVDSAGLVGALQDLVDREIWKTPCRLEINRPFHIDDDAAASHLYRIAREAVINANKHAQAREIMVELGRSKKGNFLSITDDGVGFQNKPNKPQGLGFHIMNYRARAAGGHLEVASPRRGGTRIVCYLPETK